MKWDIVRSARHFLYFSLLLMCFVGCKKTSQLATVKSDSPAAAADVNFDDTTNLFPDYTIYDHGKECFDAMDSTPFPSINCLDGTLLPVIENGTVVTDRIPQTCDTPDLVDQALGCIPGARIRKTVAGSITSIYMCRRLPRDKPWPVESAMTQNIAAMQYNSRTNAVCWFQIRKHADGISAKDLPPPYELGRVKGDTRDKVATDLYVEPGKLIRGDACIRCHDSQLVIRSPFVSQAKYSSDPKEVENAVPDFTNHNRLTHIGRAFAAWNEDAQQPYRFHIEPSYYDQKFPPTADEVKLIAEDKMVVADGCTTCHAIGKSRLEHGTPNAHRGTCNDMLTPWTHPGVLNPVNERWLSDTGKKASLFYWMPPEDAPVTADAWMARYKRAIAAVRKCCDEPDLEIGGTKICQR